MGGEHGRRRARGGSERGDRGHELGDHTADISIHAWASTPSGLFEELALALSALTAEVSADSRTCWSEVEVCAQDLDGLAFAWLNELIGMAELERRAITSAQVAVTEQQAGGDRAAWRLRARVGLVDYRPGGARALRQVKAATMHALHIREQAGGWSVDVVVDI